MKTYVSSFFTCDINFAIKAFLYNTEYLYILDSETELNNTHKMRCRVSTATMVSQRASVLRNTFIVNLLLSPCKSCL